jgi:methionine synthase II (cobalamin-independent)
MRMIFGELPDLPHLAELPARGPGADITGRTAALLVDLPVESGPSGWRFTTRPGRELSRARSMLASDLDALEETGAGYTGPLKVAVCGPWTLAATIELARSQDPALADPGALADLTESLAEGVRLHLAEVAKRVPRAGLLLQLDEPSLPTVLAGGVPTASGLNRLPAPDAPAAQAGLQRVISAAGTFTLIHCCSAPIPFGIMKDAGAGGVSFDLGRLRRGDEESLAEAVEAGLGIFAGVLPALPAAGSERAGAQDSDAERNSADPPAPQRVADRVGRLWQRMGWPSSRTGAAPAGRASVSAQVVFTPACGLAGATPEYARAVLARCREAARLLPELIEEGRW